MGRDEAMKKNNPLFSGTYALNSKKFTFSTLWYLTNMFSMLK